MDKIKSLFLYRLRKDGLFALVLSVLLGIRGGAEGFVGGLLGTSAWFICCICYDCFKTYKK